MRGFMRVKEKILFVFVLLLITVIMSVMIMAVRYFENYNLDSASLGQDTWRTESYTEEESEDRVAYYFKRRNGEVDVDDEDDDDDGDGVVDVAGDEYERPRNTSMYSIRVGEMITRSVGYKDVLTIVSSIVIVVVVAVSWILDTIKKHRDKSWKI